MKIFVNDEEVSIDHARKIRFEIGEVVFRISVNKFRELVINKMQYGDGQSEIIIKPSVSNEIRID